MIKILTVIGARPQIIKAAALSRAISSGFSDSIQEIIIHTGQHYDTNMSTVFFEELAIPLPDHNLNIGSGSHGETTGKMIAGLEKLMLDENPDYVVLYGDTNSTLAGAIAASKIHIPIVHIEAGLRSFNKRMPEEINRIMCDNVSTLLFCPTEQGFHNLITEGFKVHSGPYTADLPGVFHCGDVMFDNSKYFGELASKKSNIISTLALENSEFILSTIHRAENTDDSHKLSEIFKGLITIANESGLTIVLPIHPRTLGKLDLLETDLKDAILNHSLIKLIEPVSFLDMINLEKNCSMVITDSGGVQKEAYFFKKPCLILREETEWVEIVETGSGILVGADSKKIFNAFLNLKNDAFDYPEIFGDGQAAKFICKKMLQNQSTNI
jgi:UDP-GlcNAc3NAcA epimerase